jgi:GMP synthase (glutamine-hydrolysing)
MTGKKIFVIKAGDTFADLIEAKGNFEDWIISGLGLETDLVQVVNAERGEGLPGPDAVQGAVISGAHSMVTQDLSWSLNLERWTRQIIEAGIPILGICYGHQIMARAMGGEVDFHPRGTEIGTTQIHCLEGCKEDLLFSSLPTCFKVHVFHSQSVSVLPPGAEVLAENGFEPHQAFRMGAAAWGVQFHPEATAEVTRGYIRNLSEDLVSQGLDIQELEATLEETPFAAALLEKFGNIAAGR